MFLGSPGFQYYMVSHLKEVTKRWFGLENDNDKTARWMLLWVLLHSRPLPYCPSTISSGGSMKFISPDFLGVIIVSHLQWNITLFLELLHILGSWLRWSYVLFFFLSVFKKNQKTKPGQVFVFAEVCRFSLLLMCSLLCADGQENSGLLPCLPPETDAKSSKSSQWVFSFFFK